MIPRASYRLQLHKQFTFADAAAQAGYLSKLGVSHVYTSPILAARAGSMHGYDVIDHSRLNPELGGEDGFRALASTLKGLGLGLIVDIVPNHMAVGKADNAWWLDLLQKGPNSVYARTFDIDWDVPGFEGKVVAPFLDGSPQEAIAKGDLGLERKEGRWSFCYFEHRFPLRPQDQATDWSGISPSQLAALLDRQHFALMDWRQADANINWRRFFDITDLAAIRVGEPEVFRAVHQKIFSLYAEGLIDGVRIDHIDGLADPDAYCNQLRDSLEALRPGAYILLEKILADGEDLPSRWRVDGTTGYDFMNEASAFLHGEDDDLLERLWQRYSGRGLSMEQEEVQARTELLATKFAAQLAATTRAFEKVLPGRVAVREALSETIIGLRRYRSYATGRRDSPGPGAALEAAIREAISRRPQLEPILTALLGCFRASDGAPGMMDALRRFHQLSAPIAAKAVEDTAFYRYGRLLSRNDVGFDPRRQTMGSDAFHRRMAARLVSAPGAMLATATHDHKRGEDSRARLAALSHHGAAWSHFVAKCDRPDDIHPADFYFLLQTLVGSWPDDGADEAFGERIQQWCEKYLREAKLRSSWSDPHLAYEGQLKALARQLCSAVGCFFEELTALLETIRPQAEANSLIQTVLHYTVPGMPDLYQGCDFCDFSLVDPDNRRPVNYTQRALSLTTHSCSKQDIIAALLSVRASDPMLWQQGSYVPIVFAASATSLFGFQRHHNGSSLLVVACRQIGTIGSHTLTLGREYTDMLTGLSVGPGETPVGEILAGRSVTALYGC